MAQYPSLTILVRAEFGSFKLLKQRLWDTKEQTEDGEDLSLFSRADSNSRWNFPNSQP